jgi:hypothetical protein
VKVLKANAFQFSHYFSFLLLKAKYFVLILAFIKQEKHFQNANQTTQTDFTINKAELKEETKKNLQIVEAAIRWIPLGQSCPVLNTSSKHL